MWPELPYELIDHGLTDLELAELWKEVVTELADPQFSGRTHNNRRTHDAGCKGPICKKAVREYARRRNSTSANEKYKFVDPILDFWTPIAIARIAEAQAKVVEQLTS
jgi:hypothetical protein